MALGLRGTAYNFRINWDQADVKNKNDIVPLTYARNVFLPNVGFGMYYFNKWMYAGVECEHGA